jgi:hypothetical protein
MKSILDPSFCYTKKVETDLRKTFAGVRPELRKQQHGQQQHGQSTESVDATRKVLPFHTRQVAM